MTHFIHSLTAINNCLHVPCLILHLTAMDEDDDHYDGFGNIVDIDDIGMEWTTSSVYERECDHVPRIQARQNQKMTREYRHANRDSLRIGSVRNMINREQRINNFLAERDEVKRMTSYPMEVFEGIIRYGLLANVIEERLAVIGERTYPASWALLETMHYLASGSTYKRTADMFANGTFRQARVIRVVQRLVAHRLPAPKVTCIVDFYVLFC